jgi:NitT/TauT family transport system ATP-binding protein
MAGQESRFAVEVRDLKYKYIHSRYSSGFSAIESISFSVDSGEILAIVGPSGCGKTTLLKIVSGLLRPSSGSARLWGEDAAIARQHKRIGFVFQSPSMLPWRTVADNVRLPLELRDDAAISQKTDSALQMVGLAGFEEFYPGELSGGMLARANLARALASDPELLLLDEPFAHLDDLSRSQLQHDVVEICQGLQMTALLVTHNLAEAVSFSDKLVILSSRPAKVLQIIELDSSQDKRGAYGQQVVDKVREQLSKMSYQ